MASIIKTTGETQEVEPANGTDFSLKETQSVVGGSVEVVYLSDGRLMLVNEDGHGLGLPYNPVATGLWLHSPIMGNVIVCERMQIR